MGNREGGEEAMTLPIMCELTPEAIKARRSGLPPGLVELATASEAFGNGYQLTFSASEDALQAITRTIDAERQCCRWLRFELVVTEGGGPVILTLSGPEGAREFLAAVFEL
jgi:hypothetical protein